MGQKPERQRHMLCGTVPEAQSPDGALCGGKNAKIMYSVIENLLLFHMAPTSPTGGYTFGSALLSCPLCSFLQ